MLKKGGLTALLLFGMFFGAGNLTFPPQLGFESGGHFWPAIAGFNTYYWDFKSEGVYSRDFSKNLT